MEQHRSRRWGVESEGAVCIVSYALLCHFDNVICCDLPFSFGQSDFDIIVSFVCGEKVFIVRPGHYPEVLVEVAEYGCGVFSISGICDGRHLPEGGVFVYCLSEPFEIVGGAVLVGFEITPEIMALFGGGLVPGRAVACAHEGPEMRFDDVGFGPSVAFSFVGEFVVDYGFEAADAVVGSDEVGGEG